MDVIPEPRLTLGTEGERSVVSLAGDWDMGQIADLRDSLQSLDKQRDAIFDLCKMTFIDSTVISALLDGRKRLIEAGRSVSLRLPDAGMIRRVFELMSLEKLFGSDAI